MKRIILAIILGLLLPFICLVVLGLIGEYLPASLMLTKMYDEDAPGILLAPFSIPIYLDIFLKQKHIAPILFDNFLFRFSSFIFFNWFLYGIIMYFILGKLKKINSAKIIHSEIPPPPPKFEQI